MYIIFKTMIMRGPRGIQQWLIIFWFGVLLTGEWLIFRWAVWRCEGQLRQISGSTQQQHRYLRVAIIADPQLTDAYSYQQSGLGLAITTFYSDLYMSRCFNSILAHFNPDNVVILGDLFDGGREWLDQLAFNQELSRFRRVFRLSSDTDLESEHRFSGSAKTRMIYAAGNHDVGFEVVPLAFERFQNVFGNTTRAVRLGKENQLVILDTISLSQKSSPGYKQARDFIETFSNNADQRKSTTTTTNTTTNTILFSHIPLFRTQDCINEPGKKIRYGKGYQYQNLIDDATSKLVLETIKPTIVFSGDDHNTCLVRHRVNNNNELEMSISEFTLGTFSWLQGNWHPSFVMLLLRESTDGLASGGPSFEFLSCQLPSQIQIYILYAILFVISLLVVGTRSIRLIGKISRFRFAKFDNDIESQQIRENGRNHRMLWFSIRNFVRSVSSILMTSLAFYCLLLYSSN